MTFVLSTQERSLAFLNPSTNKIVKIYCDDRSLPFKGELQNMAYEMITGEEAARDIKFWHSPMDKGYNGELWTNEDKAFIMSSDCQFR